MLASSAKEVGILYDPSLFALTISSIKGWLVSTARVLTGLLGLLWKREEEDGFFPCFFVFFASGCSPANKCSNATSDFDFQVKRSIKLMRGGQKKQFCKEFFENCKKINEKNGRIGLFFWAFVLLTVECQQQFFFCITQSIKSKNTQKRGYIYLASVHSYF